MEEGNVRGGFRLPFDPYGPQEHLMRSIRDALDAPRVVSTAAMPASSTVPFRRIVAAELPTGCGKTLALLSAVLSWQDRVVRHGTVFEQDSYFLERCDCNYCEAERRRRQKNGATKQQQQRRRVNHDQEEAMVPEDAEEAEWVASELFFKQFRTNSAKRLRVEGDQRSSSVLKRQHLVPPCTIFYATRTHSQIRQCVKELRRFKEAGTSLLKHNIMASRLHYCINRKVKKLVQDKVVAVERNNLGELCDKLVAVHQCEAVESFAQLASRALVVPLHHGGGVNAGGYAQQKKSFAWDIEDLVAEGVAMNGCPYYASRDLVQYSNINFTTYMYLLDPIIRKECKFEAAVKNHSVIVFDEAHNVGPVCQDVLSTELALPHLWALRRELEPLTQPHPLAASSQGNGELPSFAFAPTYPRDFKLSNWTLRELFTFLDTEVVGSLIAWTSGQRRPPSSTTGCSTQAVALPQVLPRAVAPPPCASSTHCASSTGTFLIPLPLAADARSDWLLRFRTIYGVVMSLGVTFNPFNVSVWALGVLKRILLVLRFALTTPSAFSCWVTWRIESSERSMDAVVAGSADRGGPNAAEDPAAVALLSIRCLDGSLALHHLAKSTYCVVLASGTLGPMPQLSVDLKLPHAHDRRVANSTKLETMHVVDVDKNFRLGVLLRTEGQKPMLNNFRSLQDPQYLEQLALTCLTIADAALARGTGALVFVPNYKVGHMLLSISERLAKETIRHARQPQSGGDNDRNLDGGDGNTAANDGHMGRRFKHMQLMMEPKEAEQMESFLAEHRRAVLAEHKRSVLFAVYRGKVSEGLDFTDDLGRLVLCVGLPLQPLMSRSVEAQRAFSGEEWYRTDAVRAVNQAIGRCLRHVNDYGAVVLLDERYATDMRLNGQLPRWCREHVRTWDSPSVACSALRSFFANHSSSRPPTTVAAQPQDVANNTERSGGPLPSQFFGNISCSAASISTLPAAESTTHDATVVAASSQNRKDHNAARHRYLQSTALKLLYESVDHVETIRREDVDRAIQALGDAQHIDHIWDSPE